MKNRRKKKGNSLRSEPRDVLLNYFPMCHCQVIIPHYCCSMRRAAKLVLFLSASPCKATNASIMRSKVSAGKLKIKDNEQKEEQLKNSHTVAGRTISSFVEVLDDTTVMFSTICRPAEHSKFLIQSSKNYLTTSHCIFLLPTSYYLLDIEL